MPDPWTHALPPDTRAVGTGDPANDEDASVDALTAMGAGFNVLNPAFAGGADPTGAADSEPAFAAAIAALPSAGGIITVPPGTYRLNSTVAAAIAPGQTVQINGAGLEATILNSYVTGDAVRMYGTSFSGQTYGQGSGINNLTIDGTNAGAASNGLHIGDLNAIRTNVQIRHFNGTGSANLFLENTINWTEQADIRALLVDGTQSVVFSKSGTGTNSFGYGNFDFTIWPGAGAGQDGIVFQSGALVYHGSLRVRGNFQSSSSALTNAVLRFTGASHVAGAHLDVQVEVPTGTYKPTTVIMDGSSTINGCYGILDFSSGGGTFTPTTVSSGQIVFTGVISGDVNLSPGAAYGAYVFGSVNTPQVLCAEINGYHGSGFPTVLADVFTWTLTANLTANMTSTFYNGTKTLGIPQRVTIIIKQAASGGPYTVTWPKPGSPTTSAPAIYWAGGTAPTMTATASATDVYNLVTADGISWFGTALQAVS